MPGLLIPSAGKRLSLPLMVMGAAAMLALPTASLAVVTLGGEAETVRPSAIDLFTPASVDPALAARIASKAREKGIPFTPAAANPILRDRTVTVAVRVDSQTAEAISVRNATEVSPGLGSPLASLKSSRFDLGAARGYQSFARAVKEGVSLPSSVRNLAMPDLAEFEPAKPSAAEKPGRLQPRIELEDERVAGRSPNTLDALAAQTVDLGGSFRLSSRIDVTAGVRLSQERERLDPLTNSIEDSQAVYVGTQIKF
ncbi:MAG: hypothetical protein V2I27_04575 [Erythrobacter sp.]|nr:hypothetical protein [Erythrobacter sp.]